MVRKIEQDRLDTAFFLTRNDLTASAGIAGSGMAMVGLRARDMIGAWSGSGEREKALPQRSSRLSWRLDFQMSGGSCLTTDCGQSHRAPWVAQTSCMQLGLEYEINGLKCNAKGGVMARRVVVQNHSR